MFDSVRVPVVRPRSRRKIELAALEFLFRYAPECLESPQPTPALKIFDRILPQHLGFKVEVDHLAPGLEGVTDLGARTVTLAEHVYEGLEAGDGRSRYCACHECGHVILHTTDLAGAKARLANGKCLQLARRRDLPAYKDPEWQANWFAAALLMPASMVRGLAHVRGQVSLCEMTNVFQVSRQAASKRLQKLNIPETW